MKKWIYTLLAFVLIAGQPYANEIANSAQETNPFKLGDTVPEVTLKDIDGGDVDLMKLVSEKKSAIIFYRGGWCPFCSRHLAELQKVQHDIIKAGYQILAISPDSPDSLRVSMDKGKLTYTLLSDSSMEAAHAFGLAFRLDDKTKARQKNFGLDLLGSSGGLNDSTLPVPAFYLVSTEGKITFSHTDPNYMKRIAGSSILEALELNGKTQD